MAGANLRVKVGAEVEGFLGQMRRLDQEFKTVTRGVNGHGLSLSKTQRALEHFAVEATGTNRVLGTLSSTLLEFGTGGIVATGVLAGIGVMALAYDKLTESSTKAMETSDKLVESLLRAARVRALGVGGEEKATIEDLGKGAAAHAQRASFFTAASTLFKGTGLDAVFGSLAEDHIEALGKTAKSTQEAVNQLGLAIGAANDKAAATAKALADSNAAAWKRQEEQFKANVRAALGVYDSLESVGVTSKNVNSTLVSSYDRLAARLRDVGDTASVARSELLALQAAMMANSVVAQHVAQMNSTGTVGPLAGKRLPGTSLVANSAVDDARDRLVNGNMPLVALDGAAAELEKILYDIIHPFDAVAVAAATLAERLGLAKQDVATGLANWGISRVEKTADAPAHFVFNKKAIGTGLKTGAAEGVADALQQFSPESLAFRAVSTGINFVIGGFAKMATSLFDGGAAAEAYAREQRRLRLELQSGIAAFKKDDLGAELANIALSADQLRQSLRETSLTISALIRDGVEGIKRAQAEQAEINAQEARNADAARRQVQYGQQYDMEDLQVRNLRALGQTDEADKLAFQERQDRERTEAYEKAIYDGQITVAEQLYLNSLETTLNNELIAFQNGLLSDAIRNGPNGFRIDPYTYDFQTPRGASSPSGADSGVDPVSPVNPTGGLSPRGGGQPQAAAVTLVFQPGALVLDKNGVMNIVLDRIDQVVGSTAGSGTSRSEALDSMRRR